MTRDINLGYQPGFYSTHPKQLTMKIFRKMVFSRYFENYLVKAVEDKYITYPIYLSIGQESIPAALSESLAGKFTIFAQHRAHSIYLSFGGDPYKLIEELMHGKGGSPMIQDGRMIGHHGLIGENASLAVGYSLAMNDKVLFFLGDCAVEEDYVGASMGFAATHKLPVFFVCQDNGLSVLTKTSVRRSWSMVDVANAYGLSVTEIGDDPLAIYHASEKLKHSLPAFLNVQTCRHNWHVGIGIDGTPEWDRIKILRKLMIDKGMGSDIAEKEELKRVEEIWQGFYQKPLEK